MTPVDAVTEGSEWIALQPDWVIPVDGPPIPLGIIVVGNGRIVHVGSNVPQSFGSLPVTRLHARAILPGLVNAHCHLEFSDCKVPIPAGARFPDWIRRVIEHRQTKKHHHSEHSESPEQEVAPEQSRRSAIEAGIVESYRNGVRWVVDMVTRPWNCDWMVSQWNAIAGMERGDTRLISDAPLHIQPCIELVDVNPQRAQQTWEFYEECRSKGHALVAPIGLAPHAPYTVSTRLTSRAVASAIESKSLVCMHLAESPEELNWLSEGTGPFERLLSPFADAEFLAHRGSVEEHLRTLATSPRSLVIHGNFLSDAAIRTMVCNRDRMGLVYCPRTHAHFGWPDYALGRRLDAGVRVFLGTDSRATNPDLNLWEEAKSVHRLYPDLDPRAILAMITTGPAKFLGIDAEVGTLVPGSKSLLSAIATTVPPNAAGCHEVERALLESDAPVEPLEGIVRYQG